MSRSNFALASLAALVVCLLAIAVHIAANTTADLDRSDTNQAEQLDRERSTASRAIDDPMTLATSSGTREVEPSQSNRPEGHKGQANPASELSGEELRCRQFASAIGSSTWISNPLEDLHLFGPEGTTFRHYRSSLLRRALNVGISQSEVEAVIAECVDFREELDAKHESLWAAARDEASRRAANLAIDSAPASDVSQLPNLDEGRGVAFSQTVLCSDSVARRVVVYADDPSIASQFADARDSANRLAAAIEARLGL